VYKITLEESLALRGKVFIIYRLTIIIVTYRIDCSSLRPGDIELAEVLPVWVYLHNGYLFNTPVNPQFGIININPCERVDPYPMTWDKR
jgi:hypothetical protein